VTSIDLVPPDAIARRETRRRLRRWGVRLGVGVGAALAMHATLVGLARAQRSELDDLTHRYSTLLEHLRRADELLEQREDLERHREAISLIRRDRTAGHYLALLGASLTTDSYLESLSLERCPPFERDAAAPKTAETCDARLRIRGRAPGHEEVGRILRAMIARSEFRGVNLVSVTDPPHTRGERPDEVTFEILCVLAEVQGSGR